SFYMNGTAFNNGTDIFIGKFNASGTALLASTYLGGSDNDGVNHVNHTTLIQVGPNTYANEYVTDSLQYNYGDQYRGEIQVDISNNIYITSSTRSNNFPTANAYDNTLGGKQDAIVAKLNPSLSQLLYCTYLGGTKNESGNSLIVNSAFEVYATGGTCSTDFPVTTGAYSTSYNGGIADGFLARLNSTGNQLLQATYVGTPSYDQSYFVQQDKYDRVYVYGQSLGGMPVMSTQPPATPYNNPGRHQFITRFHKNLSNITLSTVFGSSTTRVDISPSAFAVDKCNNIYLSGWGGNILNNLSPMSGMPLLQPTQGTTTGYDFYFMGLDSSAVQLKYGSYFGGGTSREHVDGGTSRFDPRGKIYQSVCAGCGGNQDFPVTNGAWPNTPPNPNHAFNCNNGVVKLDFQLQMSISTINTNTLAGCSPLAVTFTNATPPLNPGATFKWYFGNLLTNTTSSTPSYTFVNPGTYTVSLVVNDNLTCNKKDSSVTYVTVLPTPTANIALNYTQCTNSVALSGSGSGNLGTNPYSWNFGDNSTTSNLSSVSHTYVNNGLYTISFEVTDAAGCKATKTTTVNIFDFQPAVAASPSICYGKNVTLNASGGTTYTWLPAGSLNNNQLASPVATPTANTVYTITVNNNSPGYVCARSLTTQVLVYPTTTTNLTYTLNPCGGGVNFADKSKNDVTNWNWKLTGTKTSTIANPYYFYTTGGTYTVTLETSNVFGCKSSKDTIVVVPPPEVVTATGTLEICRGDKAQLNATGGIAYQWSPGTTLDFPATANPVASPTLSTEYSVAITTTRSAFGKECEYILTANVDVVVLSNTPVKAKAEPVLIVTGNSSTLSYLGDAGARVTWLPLNSTSPASGYTVSAKPDKPTTYTVLVNKGPCTETVLVHVDAYTEGCLTNDVFIPNTFTPNGDGNNDLLFVRSLKVSELYFTIYNRWGEMVFETKDKTTGWDGRYKGRDVDVGVYGWYLKAKCVNGEETFLKGNVTLIR
ncbi:MAG: gliding motility-associated C-terminal domain-containing protein, partial [Bacteroidia bacterium]|nr:gliding motility-associated C-terminal domain-containing protein [Bacteroidia bacterium]